MSEKQAKTDFENLPVEQFNPLHYHFFDFGVLANLPASIVLVFNAVRRCIWRTGYSSSPGMQILIEQGLLVTYPCRARLETLTGLGRTQVWKCLKVLQHLGWLRMLEIGRQTVFVLGEIAIDSDGAYREAFYSDGWLIQLQDFHNNVMREEGREFEAISPEDRIELTTEWLKDYLPSLGEIPASLYPSVEQLRQFTLTVVQKNFPYLSKRLTEDRFKLLTEERRQHLTPLALLQELLTRTLPGPKRRYSSGRSSDINLPVYCCVCRQIVNTLDHNHLSERISDEYVHSSNRVSDEPVHSSGSEGGPHSLLKKKNEKIDNFSNREGELRSPDLFSSEGGGLGESLSKKEEDLGFEEASITFRGEQKFGEEESGEDLPASPAPLPPKPPAPVKAASPTKPLKAPVATSVEEPETEEETPVVDSRLKRFKDSMKKLSEPRFTKPPVFAQRMKPKLVPRAQAPTAPRTPAAAMPVKQTPLAEEVALPQYLVAIQKTWVKAASLYFKVPQPDWSEREIEKMVGLARRYRLDKEPQNADQLHAAIVYAHHCWAQIRQQFEKIKTADLNVHLFVAYYNHFVKPSTAFSPIYRRLNGLLSRAQEATDAKQPLTLTDSQRMSIQHDLAALRKMGSTLLHQFAVLTEAESGSATVSQ